MLSSPTWSRDLYLGCWDGEELSFLWPVYIVQAYLVAWLVTWTLIWRGTVHSLTRPCCQGLSDHMTRTLVVETARSCPSSDQSMLSSPTWSRDSYLGCWDGKELSILWPVHVVQPYLFTWLVPWLLRRRGAFHPLTSPCCAALPAHVTCTMVVETARSFPSSDQSMLCSPTSSRDSYLGCWDGKELSILWPVHVVEPYQITWLIPWLLRRRRAVRPLTSPCCPRLPDHVTLTLVVETARSCPSSDQSMLSSPLSSSRLSTWLVSFRSVSSWIFTVLSPHEAAFPTRNNRFGFGTITKEAITEKAFAGNKNYGETRPKSSPS